MNPTESPGFEKTGKTDFREVFCLHYRNCLSEATMRDWPGFSCGECGHYQRDLWEPMMWLDDALRSAALLKAADNLRE
jgi:hypothetical protein